MINLDIPGFGRLGLKHLVCDFNGTLAVDGRLIPGVRELLVKIAPHLEIHVVTADTFGSSTGELAELPVNLTIIPEAGQREKKYDFITRLGAKEVVAIGNGRNDRFMLESAGLSLAVVQKEGCAADAFQMAVITCPSILDALELLVNSKRLIATLRC